MNLNVETKNVIMEANLNNIVKAKEKNYTLLRKQYCVRTFDQIFDGG